MHPEDHYERFNCALGTKKRVYLFREQEPVKEADGLVAENGTSDLEDITELVELGVNQSASGGAAQMSSSRDVLNCCTSFAIRQFPPEVFQ